MFTMTVAAMKRKVVAVDILQENIDLVKTSLKLLKLSGRVEFVLNAISDRYETLYSLFEDESNGGSSKAVKESQGSLETFLVFLQII